MKIANNVIITSIIMMVMPFCGDIFSAVAQVSAKSLMQLLLVSLGVTL
ncbi:MAG: hypothetical protein KGI08_11420 [Thaumarchaeota archaeon]|nr:hypothetical protein [Nitrososphaerota archaeon]